MFTLLHATLTYVLLIHRSRLIACVNGSLELLCVPYLYRLTSDLL